MTHKEHEAITQQTVEQLERTVRHVAHISENLIKAFEKIAILEIEIETLKSNTTNQ
jgi:hypothetical protein